LAIAYQRQAIVQGGDGTLQVKQAEASPEDKVEDFAKPVFSTRHSMEFRLGQALPPKLTNHV